MKVPVLWVSWHDDILARRYADQGLLEALFSRELWTPPDALEFEHREIRGDFPDVDGAIVILPARHHIGGDDVTRFLAELDKLKWSLVILSGDEEWAFPWFLVKETETRKVWIMQPRPEHAHLSGLIPGGWYPGTREGIARNHPTAPQKTLEWFFAGQVTHERREACATALRRLSGGFLFETAGYLQGMPPNRVHGPPGLCQGRSVPIWSDDGGHRAAPRSHGGRVRARGRHGDPSR